MSEASLEKVPDLFFKSPVFLQLTLSTLFEDFVLSEFRLLKIMFACAVLSELLLQLEALFAGRYKPGRCIFALRRANAMRELLCLNFILSSTFWAATFQGEVFVSVTAPGILGIRGRSKYLAVSVLNQHDQ